MTRGVYIVTVPSRLLVEAMRRTLQIQGLQMPVGSEIPKRGSFLRVFWQLLGEEHGRLQDPCRLLPKYAG